MKGSEMICSVLFLFVFLLWSTAGAQIFTEVKTMNGLKIGPPYDIIQNPTESSTQEFKAFIDAYKLQNNAIVPNDQTIDKSETKHSTEISKERIFMQTARKKSGDQTRSKMQSPNKTNAGKKEDGKNESFNRLIAQKSDNYQETKDSKREDGKNESLDQFSVQKSDNATETKEEKNHPLNESEAQKANTKNVDIEYDEAGSLGSRYYEPSLSDWLFPSWGESKGGFHSPYNAYEESSQLSGSEEYLGEDIINENISNNVKILAEDPDNKLTHFRTKLFKEIIFRAPIKEESDFKEIRNESSSESKIPDDIELINKDNLTEFSNDYLLILDYNEDEVLFIRPALLIDDSPFGISNNENYTSNANDRFIHKILKQKAVQKWDIDEEDENDNSDEHLSSLHSDIDNHHDLSHDQQKLQQRSQHPGRQARKAPIRQRMPSKSAPEWIIHEEEEEAAQILKRASRRCSYNRDLIHSDLKCIETESKVVCRQKCVYGYTLKQGKQRHQICHKSKGKWSPSRSFSDCKPYVDCTVTLKEGGHKYCISNYLNKKTRCHLSCDGYGHYKKVPARWHKCNDHGKWNPKLPHCAIADSKSRLVPRPRDASAEYYDESEEEEYVPKTELKSHALLGKSLVMKPEKSR